jgi:transposase
LCPKNLRECANGRLLKQPPVVDLEPVDPKAEACNGARDRADVFLKPEPLHGLGARTSKEGRWRMAQNGRLVGIDVAKGKVDAAIRSAAEASFANSAEGRRKLLEWLKEHGVDKAVMEASGSYERSWAELPRKAGLEMVIVDPKRVRHFAKSAGRLAKNDPIDARMIAWFGEVFADNMRGKPQDEDRQELDQLVTARLGLKGLQEKLEGWGEHEPPRIVQKIHQALLKELAVQLRKLEKVIQAKLKNTERFADRAEIIRSVPGLADAAAAGSPAPQVFIQRDA